MKGIPVAALLLSLFVYCSKVPQKSYQSTHNERDSETNYDHREARNSDSGWGCFLGVDALAGDYPAVSPYCYVGGNPVRMVDPGGKTGEVVENEDGTGYILNATVYIYGPEASEQEAQKLQQQINQFWNRTDAQGVNHPLSANDGLPVLFNIIVQLATVSDFAKSGTRDNFAYITNEGNTPAVLGNSMVWDLADDAQKGGTAIPHEIGHMLGFKLSESAKFGVGGMDGTPRGEPGYDDTHFKYYYPTMNQILKEEIRNPIPAMSSGGGFNPNERKATQNDIRNFNHGQGITGVGQLLAHPYRKDNFIIDPGNLNSFYSEQQKQ